MYPNEVENAWIKGFRAGKENPELDYEASEFRKHWFCRGVVRADG